MRNRLRTPKLFTESFPDTPTKNEMKGATILRLVFREELPVEGKAFDDPANAPSEEITMACDIAGRWSATAKAQNGRLELPQEIYSVNGWGFSNVLNGPVNITLNPNKKSEGLTVAKATDKAFPADSHLTCSYKCSFLAKRISFK